MRGSAALHCRSMIDTHCHLTFPHFRDRVDAVLESAARDGVLGAITVSTTTADALRCLALATAHPNVWCSAGVHPLNCDEPIDWPTMVKVARHDRCVAWGELGLDNHYDEPVRTLQDQVLQEQLAVIRTSEVDLPVIVHCREAYGDLIAVLRASGLPLDRFVFHCFTGSAGEARRILDLGAWISFTGIVTFKNARSIQEAARIAPADRIMIETDAPFLTPEPHRKISPNEPRFALATARFVANLRKTKWADFHNLINDNTHRFFGIEVSRGFAGGASSDGA